MSRPIGTADGLERRRKQAVQAVTDGEARTTVAEVLGVHYQAVARWVREGRTPGGVAAEPQPHTEPGRSDADLREPGHPLAKGAKARGWHNERWTAARVARLIERRFRITYHPEHARKSLKRRLGWTSQKARRTARERDDTEVARWVGGEVPRIARQAWVRSAYLVFLDEPGFLLTPPARRTLAPRGKTPVPAAWGRRDRWRATSCVTLSPVAGRPGRYFDLLDHTIRGPDGVAVLTDLHRRLGPLAVVWDRNPIRPKAGVVKAWRATHPGVAAEDVPGYVPDLNPDEGAGGWAKYGRLANLAADNKDVVWDHGVDGLIAGKHRPDLLSGVTQQTGSPGVTPAA